MTYRPGLAVAWPHRLPAELAERGLCASGRHDPEVWFPEATDKLGIERAIWFCRSCPVIAACREHVLAAPGPVHGVWGGLTLAERTRLRREQVRQRRQADSAA